MVEKENRMPYVQVHVCRQVLALWSTKDMASSSVAWPSVIIKTVPFVVGGRKVIKAEWSDMFGKLLVYCSGLDCVHVPSVSY